MSDNAVIWCYPLDQRFNILKVPKGAKILTTNRKPDESRPSIWMEVNPHADKEDRAFVIVPIWEKVPCMNGIYLGTFFHGLHVNHIYEVCDDECPRRR